MQDASATTYGPDFTPWLDASGTGLELRRTEIAANGQLAALGVDQSPAFPAAVDCSLAADGVAKEASLFARRAVRRLDRRRATPRSAAPTSPRSCRSRSRSPPRARSRRLKGVRLTLRITQAGRTTTKRAVVR